MTTIEKLFQELAKVIHGALQGSSITRSDHDTVVVIRRHGEFYLRVAASYNIGFPDPPKVEASFERMGPDTDLLASEVLDLHQAAIEAQFAVGMAQRIIQEKWPRD